MELLKKINEDHVFVGVGALGALVILYILFSPEEDSFKLTVSIEDGQGNQINYDPSALIKELRKTLTTTYYFGQSERHAAFRKLHNLDNYRFMAVVKGYQRIYKTSLDSDMRAVVVPANHFDSILNRIEVLSPLVK